MVDEFQSSTNLLYSVEQTKYLLKPLQLADKSATEDGSVEDSTVAMVSL